MSSKIQISRLSYSKLWKMFLENSFAEDVDEREILLDLDKDNNDPLDYPEVQKAIRHHADEIHNGDIMQAQMDFEGELDDYINDTGSAEGFKYHVIKHFPDVFYQQSPEAFNL